MEFRSFNFHPLVAAGVEAAGYVTPAPIQEQAIPPVMEGIDVMGLAQTGTGKTAAFSLPILHSLLENPGRGIRALVIAPTRELAEQIHESICTLGRKTRIRSITVYGGVNGPYIWLKTPAGVTSWDFFDKLLNECNVVGTPGSGFGPSGEGYFRLSAFGHRENVIEAVERIKKNLK